MCPDCGKPNAAFPIIVQGDSRNLTEILRGLGIGAGGAITSPPYIDTSRKASETPEAKVARLRSEGKHEIADLIQARSMGAANDLRLAGYGSTPGQQGAMKEGSHLAAITSPPFSQPETRDRYPVQTGNVAEQFNRKTPGQGGVYTLDRQGQTEGNLAAMPIGAVTSPPYEEGLGHQDSKPMADGTVHPHYPNGLALGKGDTYWAACTVIYRQLYDLFSPNSHLAIVLKSFVRRKRIVDLPQMTLDLLVSIGFEPVAWVDAMLVSEAEQRSALPEMVPHKRKKRMSFFRLLHERKHPETAIDAEVVLVVRRP